MRNFELPKYERRENKNYILTFMNIVVKGHKSHLLKLIDSEPVSSVYTHYFCFIVAASGDRGLLHQSLHLDLLNPVINTLTDHISRHTLAFFENLKAERPIVTGLKLL